LIHKAWLIFKKDIKQEFVTRFTVNAILLFSIVTLTAVSFSIGAYAAGQEINATLGKLLLTYENYPDLKTIEAVNSLMDELAGTQNRITVARGRFITSVQKYNTGIKVFPANLVANAFGFEQVEYFKANENVSSSVELNL